jgi:hypothetical protein
VNNVPRSRQPHFVTFEHPRATFLFVTLSFRKFFSMKKFAVLVAFGFLAITIFAGNVEKVFTFSQVNISRNGQYQTISLDHTMQAGLTGEPMLPYHQVAMMLPPGEKAISMRISGEGLIVLPGTFDLYPQQYMQPVSQAPDGKFIKNEAIYRSAANYPSTPVGNLINSYLNGYAFALSTFTPAIYNPAKKTVSYYQKVTVQITTQPDVNATLAMKNLTASGDALKRVRMFAQNPDMMNLYPAKGNLKSNYKILIITPSQFQNGFQDLVDFYNTRGQATQVATTESISAMPGQDLQEKMRNYIITEYQTNGIEQVILGGDVEYVPCRGFYCYVVSGSGYEDYTIPADIYFSSLDGNWNTNGNNKWGEPGEDDLLPEISVGRMSFSNAAELANMVHKSVSYQGSPVPEELKKPYLVSEFLYDPPMTWGSDYLELLVDDHTDNGYSTHGIPSAQNTITRLYDAPGYNWGVGELLAGINSGQSFIHHCGHSNSNYMMRLYNWDITNENFSQVDGIAHNYQLMYTHGCICGAFDDSDCIAERSTSIANFLVGGVFNSRYGWFDQGTTEGPSAHLHREFISALYHPNPDSAIAQLGSAHTMSKIMTAPWIGLPGEFEPGAQRWCHYDCNVLGDPALKVWTDNPSVGISDRNAALRCSISPNPCTDKLTLTFNTTENIVFQADLLSVTGQTVLQTEVSIPGNGNSSASISLPQLETGIYFLRLTSPMGVITRQVVIAR